MAIEFADTSTHTNLRFIKEYGARNRRSLALTVGLSVLAICTGLQSARADPYWDPVISGAQWSTDWLSPENWSGSPGGVPGADEKVNVFAGTEKVAVLAGDGGTIGHLFIGTRLGDGAVTITGAATALTVTGDIFLGQRGNSGATGILTISDGAVVAAGQVNVAYYSAGA